jgi:3D (Asp-Asp-Asp) domain-containing protein
MIKSSGILFSRFLLLSGLLYLVMGFAACNKSLDNEENIVVWDSLTVTASAFNSTRAQTGSGNPNVTAWGDTIEPGMKILAVSRDLIAKGLEHNTEVIIEGIEGVFVVKDKMHYRWKNKIDIYMGENIKKAKSFGRKKVKIFYKSRKDTIAFQSL